MSQLENKQTEALRHERKFLIEDYSASEVEQLLKYHPACFTQIYHPRTVNNIYFDTLGFDSYYGNLEGDTERTKARIRWYGKLFGQIDQAVLEFKIKKGLLGTKRNYPLTPFCLDEKFSKEQLIKALDSEHVPSIIAHSLQAMQPALLNSYSRKYFISADKQFRITIDTDLLFYRISYNENTFLNKVKSPRSVVVELKYDSKLEEQGKEIGSKLPFKMTKNSKYLQGVEYVLF
jgi:SPX domain protein involved in polyphosphate accumulation